MPQRGSSQAFLRLAATYPSSIAVPRLSNEPSRADHRHARLCRLLRAWAACGLALATTACGPAEPEAPLASSAVGERPHVVLVVLDTVRADRLGCYGFASETSPALDRLAASGVVFERVLAPASWTRPSIGALLTSQHPRSLGLFVEQGQALPEEATTLAEVLHDAGYLTYGFTANPNINSTYGFHQGFDEHADCKVLFPWMPAREGAVTRGRAPLPAANELFTRALELVDAAPAGRPVYLQLTLMEAHEWTAAQRMPQMLRSEHAQRFGDDPWCRYLQLVRQMTDDLGVFVSTLKSRPGWSDAWFVFVGDHGEGLGDHPDVENARHHGLLLYSSQVRVPWILHRDGWQPALSRVAQEVRLLDVLPTLLDELDLPVPPSAVGVSLMPVLRGTSARVALPEIVVSETYFQRADQIAAYAEDFAYIRARSPRAGMAIEELQRRGVLENGVRTSLLDAESARAAELRAFLQAWEARHPPRDSTAPARALDADEAQLLRSIGY